MYRLTRDFFTTKYDEDDNMSDLELTLKKYTALTLGFFPFISSYAWLFLFKHCTNLITTYGLIYTIKLFSLSQYVVWGKYVPFPSGETPNSRLAQYGASEQLWLDLDTIKRALYEPENLNAYEWTLQQWKEVEM